MFSNPQIRRLATSSNEESLSLSQHDWHLVLNANRNFNEEREHWKGNVTWGRYLLNKIGDDARVVRFQSALELCGGSGFLFFSFRELFAIDSECDFIDISETQLNSFRRRCSEQGTAKPSLVRGDIGMLPFADSSKALVYGHSFLHHLPDVGHCLAEAARVIKPGGYFVAFHEPTRTAPMLESFPRPLLRRIDDSSLTDIWLIRPEVAELLLRRAGFSKVRIYPSGLLASLLVVPWQMVLAKLRRPYQTPFILKLRALCDDAERFLPLSLRLCYSPSIALVAEK